jgi:DNA mismatch repair protein MutS
MAPFKQKKLRAQPKPESFDEYFGFHEQYTAKFGPRTVVLHELGKFYEILNIIDEEGHIINGPDLEQITSLLNFVLTRKNTNYPAGPSNPQMAGINKDCSKRHIDLLVENDYIVVLAEKVSDNPLRRAVTQVISKTTSIDCHDVDYNYLSVIVIDEYEQFRSSKKVWAVGLSALDVSTGRSTVYEVVSNSKDSSNAVDETIRFISTFQPKELIVCNKTQKSESELRSLFELYNRQIHFVTSSSTIEKISYQNEFFQKIYDFTNMLSPIENLQLEHSELARLSLLLLIQFVFERNELLVQNLKMPTLFDNTNHLILENNAISQLNVLENGQISGKLSCLLNVVNFTSTAVGKRALKDRLLLPITDPEKLQERYDATELLLPHVNKIDAIMKGMVDFERNQNKIDLLKIHPNELARMDSTYQKILELNDFMKSISYRHYDFIERDFQEFYGYFKSIFELEELIKYSQNQIESNIFKPGVCVEVDEISAKLDSLTSALDDMVAKLSVGDAVVKWEFNDKDGLYLTATKSRWAKINKEKTKITFQNITGPKLLNLTEFTIKTSKQDVRLTHPILEHYNDLQHSYFDQIRKICQQQYITVLEFIRDKYGYLWSPITEYLGDIDCTKSAAKCATTYNYCKPEIHLQDDPFIYADNARHPIIERLPSKTIYVPNWICLGNIPEDLEIRDDQCPASTMNGMLLYSCNSTGKSSYMKSIALNLILAQSGHFVAAENFAFSPFQKIMTRILSNDNLFKGLSSFAVEMLELRSILNRADQHTLVVADELANQSEVASGTAIVAASIKSLHDKNVKFVTATHFHQLPKIELINELEGIHHYHLEVHFNEATGVLEYDRKLKKGSGNSIYGLEVAKALDLDKNVLALANDIRKELLDVPKEIVSTKESTYNANVYKDICYICKTEKKGDVPSCDVHHINFQMDSVNGFNKGHIRTNSAGNLVNLCKRHHNQVHKPFRGRQLVIKCWKQTSAGIMLDYEYVKV